MARRARRSGGPLSKSRGKRRGPRDRRASSPSTSEDFNLQISAWLALESREERLHTLDLRAFLRECPGPSYAAGDRLRRLAIYLDDNGLVWRDRPMQIWEVYARIYDEAERLSPKDSAVCHARAFTAIELGWWRSAEEPARTKLLSLARAAVERGLSLDPEDAELHYLAGYVYYMDDPSEKERALEHCERALALAGKHLWAALYRAHCLHDLERWAEAAAAYVPVEHGHFDNGRGWRGELAREQRAYCLWRSGARAEAGARFEQLLELREAAVARGEDKFESDILHQPPTLLAEALSSGDFEPEWFERLRAHLEQLDELWVFEHIKGRREE